MMTNVDLFAKRMRERLGETCICDHPRAEHFMDSDDCGWCGCPKFTRAASGVRT